MTNRGDGTDLQALVATTADAIDQQEHERGPVPSPRRPRTGLAAIAILAFAVTAVTRGGALLGAPTDPDAALAATAQALDLTRQLVQSHWDSTGRPPASLAEVGMAAMPFDYRATEDAFRLAALVPPGDTIGYQSPARPRAPRGPGAQPTGRTR